MHGGDVWDAISLADLVNFGCVEKLRLRFACVHHFAYIQFYCACHRVTSTKLHIRAQANSYKYKHHFPTIICCTIHILQSVPGIADSYLLDRNSIAM